MHILLIEDDVETAEYVSQGLADDGHVVDVASDGREGLFRATGGDWDLLIVDRMLPALDGLVLVRTLRTGGIETPVLFLTTLGGVGDRVAGLRAGGDDYIVKPFALAELSARVEALGRRPQRIATGTVLKVADLEVDLLARTVRRAGQSIELQQREFQLLAFLLQHTDQIVTRTMLLENIWDFHFDPRTNVVESHISRLRGKLGQHGGPELIHTVRGAGYSVRAPE